MSFERTTSNYGYIDDVQAVKNILREWEFSNEYGTVQPRVTTEDHNEHEAGVYITGGDLFWPYKPSEIGEKEEVTFEDYDPVGLLSELAPYFKNTFKLQTIGGEDYQWPFTLTLYVVDPETETVTKKTHDDICEDITGEKLE